MNIHTVIKLNYCQSIHKIKLPQDKVDISMKGNDIRIALAEEKKIKKIEGSPTLIRVITRNSYKEMKNWQFDFSQVQESRSVPELEKSEIKKIEAKETKYEFECELLSKNVDILKEIKNVIIFLGLE